MVPAPDDMPTTKRKVERWEGGYIRVDSKGRPTYIIQRTVASREYHVSTRTHGARAAMEHLKRFEQDPSAYTPQGTEADRPLYLNDTLIEEYREHCAQKNSHVWLQQKMVYVKWWKDTLPYNTDLRRLHLEKIVHALDQGKARAHRIAVLKHLYAWLRTERHALTTAEDPTYGILRVPQSNPAARATKDKSVPHSQMLLVREHLVGHWRDALDVLAATGVHVRALVRFARAGTLEPYRGSAEAHSVLVFPLEKDGETHRAAVNAQATEAARRLIARGHVDEKRLVQAVAAACRAANVPIWTPARMRHSVATWAIEAGADPAAVAAFLGHKSAATTRKFYATHATPPPVLGLVK